MSPLELTSEEREHVLVITGDTPNGREYMVEHPDCCPVVCRWYPSRLADVEEVISRTVVRGFPLVDTGMFDCAVENEIQNVGLDSLALAYTDDTKRVELGDGIDGWRKIEAGRYTIEAWSTQFYWSGTEPVDADSGILLTGRAG